MRKAVIHPREGDFQWMDVLFNAEFENIRILLQQEILKYLAKI